MSRGQQAHYAELKQRALEMRADNPYLNINRIAKELGVHRTTVGRWLDSDQTTSWHMDAECPRCGGKMHRESEMCRTCFERPERRAEVIRRYMAGQAPWTIAFALREDPRRMRYYIKRLKEHGLLPYRRDLGQTMQDVTKRPER